MRIEATSFIVLVVLALIFYFYPYRASNRDIFAN